MNKPKRNLTGKPRKPPADVRELQDPEYDEDARRLGHTGSFGENIYMAEGPFVVPRVALDRWLNSEGHRENLFRPESTLMGVGLVSGVDVERVRDGVVWVQQFGD